MTPQYQRLRRVCKIIIPSKKQEIKVNRAPQNSLTIIISSNIHVQTFANQMDVLLDESQHFHKIKNKLIKNKKNSYSVNCRNESCPEFITFM